MLGRLAIVHTDVLLLSSVSHRRRALRPQGQKQTRWQPRMSTTNLLLPVLLMEGEGGGGGGCNPVSPEPPKARLSTYG